MTDLTGENLARLCEAHGIAPRWFGIDGSDNAVPEDTLKVLAEAFDIENAEPATDGGIEEVLGQPAPEACYVPESLLDSRAWGVSCQLGSLRSDRNCGMGDFADLAQLAKMVGDAKGDFIGLNPLHALYWAEPARVSPFSPSNRSALNPLYLALDWIDGADLTADEAKRAANLREAELVDAAATHAIKDAALRRAFAQTDWAIEGNATDIAHAEFEALSGHFAPQHGAGWMGWPEQFRDRESPETQALLKGTLAEEVRYHAWLQALCHAQLDRVNAACADAGLRIGLYLDLAVGVSADGSATWIDPDLCIAGLKIGAPPDPFSASGQDWGLAPLSPTVLRDTNARPFADMMEAVMRHAGAVRVDHAMSLARLFLIPSHSPALDGAYVRYPLAAMLKALADVSNTHQCVVIGEDLGVVPEGFRPIMEARALHAYKVFWFERDEHSFDDPQAWSRNALACVGTHDTATFAGWWTGSDIDARRDIGQFDDEAHCREHEARQRDRNAVRRAVGWHEDVDWRDEDVQHLSALVHQRIARAPCRLAVMQLDDVLGAIPQPNMPGTMDEHPNWRRKLPVTVDELATDGGFTRHADIMRQERP
jgi:4-alpha-glucanotransferase